MEANGDGTGKQLLLLASGKSGYQLERRAGPELAAFSPQRQPALAPRQVPREINADSGLASLLFHAPPPAAGTAPEEQSWQAPWCHIMKCQLTWCKQAPAADGQRSPACFWAEASVNWPDNAIKTSLPHAA